jgi:hypothetical protein
MGKNRTTETFGGFEEAFDFINGEKPSSITAKTDYAKEVDPEDLEKLAAGDLDEDDEDVVETEEEVEEDVEDTKEDIDEDEEEHATITDQDDEDIVIEKLKKKKIADKNKSKAVVEEGVDEEDEKEIVGTFFNLFAEELGWEVEDENKPGNVKELLDTISGIIAENSRPEYASEEVAKIDAYIRQGGDLNHFLKETSTGIDLSKLDLKDEDNQKKVIKENFKRLGYSDEKIEKRIARFEDAFILEEEAQEAVESLTAYKAEKEKKLLKEIEESNSMKLKEQQSFITNVNKTIQGLDSVQGIPISAKEKKELFDYLFKTDAEGKTGYQKDYSGNINNLIVSAYVTKNGDKLFKKAVANANTNAVVELKRKLKTKKARNQKPYESGSLDTDVLSLISKTLTRY